MKLVLSLFLLFVDSAIATGLLVADGMTSVDFVTETKTHIKSIDVTEAKSLFDKGCYLFLDVREPYKTELGTIPEAIVVPRGLIEFRILNIVENKNANVVV